MSVKILIIAVLAFVLFQLFYALVQMMKATQESKQRMVRSLMWRVTGSLTVFIIILAAYAGGFLKPSSYLFS